MYVTLVHLDQFCATEHCISSPAKSLRWKFSTFWLWPMDPILHTHDLTNLSVAHSRFGYYYYYWWLFQVPFFFLHPSKKCLATTVSTTATLSMSTPALQHHGIPFKQLLALTCGSCQRPLVLWQPTKKSVRKPNPVLRRHPPRTFSLTLKINFLHLCCPVGPFRHHDKSLLITRIIDHAWDPCRVWIPKCRFEPHRAMENVPRPRNKLWETPPTRHQYWDCHEVGFYNWNGLCWSFIKREIVVPCKTTLQEKLIY